MAQNYVLLERIELNQSATSVTFSNIPQTGYTDLKIVISGRTSEAAGLSAFRLALNGVTTGFTNKDLFGDGTGATSQNNNSSGYIWTNGNNYTANTFSNGELYFPNYTSSSFKSFSTDIVMESNAAAGVYAQINAQLWSNTAAITSITLTANVGSILANSTFSLYGIAKLGTTPAIAPKADGGNVIATDGTYWYHAFRSNGTFTPLTALSCDVLVVAGGGGGGFNFAAGGGAGGLVYQTQSIPASTSQAITVGAGGAGGILSSTTFAANGSNSTIGSLVTAIGGGGGGGSSSTYSNLVGKSGGSGGGGGGYYYSGTVPGGSGTSGQGYAGGSGIGDTIAPYGHASNGGGGGAGAVGGSPASVSSVGGAGGVGLYYDSFGAATGTGQYISSHYYYAGGGGGASSVGVSSGGYGGGGQGGQDGGTQGTVGTINTGGGGGGSKGNNTDGLAGGSGVVIIRYPVA